MKMIFFHLSTFFFAVTFTLTACGPLGVPIASGIKTKSILRKRAINSIDSGSNKIVSSGDKFSDDGGYFLEDDVVGAIQKVYKGLTNRMNGLQEKLLNVEKQTASVLNRLTLSDCYDLKLQQPLAMSGVYSLHLDYKGKRPVRVACDMVTDGGGWTILQQRLPRDYNDTKSHTNFNRGFYDYKLGFGNPDEDYWVGLENIYMWTNTRHYELRVDMTDFKGEPGTALYRRFHIEDESNAYRLHISGYAGNIGDALGGEGKLDNFTADGMMFSTKDQDRDTSHEINCSAYWNIGGWWLNRCSWANLNAPYKFPDEGDGTGINWHTWRDKKYLKSTKMMIRPSKKP